MFFSNALSSSSGEKIITRGEKIISGILKYLSVAGFIGIIVLRIIASMVGPVFAIVILVWTGFMVVPIWKSSDKYKGNSLFALLAKIAAVLIALGVLGSLF